MVSQAAREKTGNLFTTKAKKMKSLTRLTYQWFSGLGEGLLCFFLIVVCNRVSIALGCCDKTRDAGVVLIYCKHSAWTSQYLTITNLTTLLLYYQHLSR